MASIQNLCIYCSASSVVDERYKIIARAVGALCAQNNIRIIYGGGRVGLMGEVAVAALKAGGKVTGVIPQSLVDREVAHTSLSELIVTKSLHERQEIMADLSDGFLMLPGGLGTLAEFFEIVTWKQLGLHSKPVVILNAFEYWDPLMQMIEKASAENFLHRNDDDLFKIVQHFEELGRVFDFHNKLELI